MLTTLNNLISLEVRKIGRCRRFVLRQNKLTRLLTPG